MEGWLKLNADGVVQTSSKLATAGAIIRDAYGHWVGSLVMNISVALITRAELWGVYEGI